MFQVEALRCPECSVYSDTLFQSIPARSLNQGGQCKQTLHFSKGEMIFHAGDKATSFFCVSGGRVQLFRNSSIREQSFAIAEPGAWIGYRDCLSGHTYEHSARALADTKVCKMAADMLGEFMQKYPAFTAAIMKDLANGWVDSERQSYNLGARKTTERLADFLLSLKADTQLRTQQEVLEFSFPLTRETVATLIGSTTESVIRTLSDFKSRGWIDFSNGSIQILNEEQLKKLVSES